jgi:hypothetical protein
VKLRPNSKHVVVFFKGILVLVGCAFAYQALSRYQSGNIGSSLVSTSFAGTMILTASIDLELLWNQRHCQVLEIARADFAQKRPLFRFAIFLCHLSLLIGIDKLL